MFNAKFISIVFIVAYLGQTFASLIGQGLYLRAFLSYAYYIHLSMQILGTINNGILGGCFGRARGRMHNGIDLSGSIGDPVYATHSGTVIRVEPVCPVEDSGMNWDRYKSNFKPTPNEVSSLAPGKRVYIDCGGGFVTWYWHLNSTNVQQNNKFQLEM